MPVILVAEDDINQFELICLQFKQNIKAGEFTFLHAGSGEMALQVLVENKQIELLITDINMPGMDGLELINIVKNKYPHLKTIIMSAFADMANIRAAMNQGAFDFITKPFVKSDLLQTINKALDEIKRFNKMVSAVNAAEEANRLKSEFLANVSHELLTPMHGILSFSDIGTISTNPDKDPGPDFQEQCHDYFSTINESANRLLSLIKDLLKLSKLESGRNNVAFISGNINYLIKQNIAILKSEINSKNIELDIIEESKAEVLFNELMINDVVQHILKNAIQFSPDPSKITIKITTNAINKEQPAFLELSVSDEGYGIPKDELESIFDKFNQSSLTNTGAGGKGLGLAICREIMTIHKGKIWAENNNSRGTTFYILLPLA